MEELAALKEVVLDQMARLDALTMAAAVLIAAHPSRDAVVTSIRGLAEGNQLRTTDLGFHQGSPPSVPGRYNDRIQGALGTLLDLAASCRAPDA